MKVSKTIREIALIISTLESRLKRDPTQNEILDAVLEFRGDKSCSASTITKARKYLEDSMLFGGVDEDTSAVLGREVLRIVTELIPAQGGYINLAMEVNSLRAQLTAKKELAEMAKSRLLELKIDDALVLATLDKLGE